MKKILYFVAALLIFAACEGPAGEDGIDGKDGIDGVDGVNGVNGVDGQTTCVQCHETGVISTVSAQFSQSAHKSGEIAVDYAGGRASCAQCHSHEGFMAYAAFGIVDGDVSGPNAWRCLTCHNLHQSFDSTDFALRLDDGVKLISDESITVDLGKSNLCINCHQSRRNSPDVTDPGDKFTITSTHYGPHHGAQGNILYGQGFAEIEGSKSYAADGSHAHANVGCVGCHMDSYTEGAGGHTFKPNIDNCKGCHSSIEDFDYANAQTDVAEKLHELQELLLAQGVLEYVVEDGDSILEPVTGVEFDMAQGQAYFNWIGIEEDRSMGVHNSAYVKALLDNTIEALSK